MVPSNSPKIRSSNGFPTFASFNNPTKLNDAVLALWAHVLLATPGSRLVMKYKDVFASTMLQDRVRGRMEREGIGAERILMSSAMQSRQDHLSLYHEVDIALDPFPFSGATTNFEALWMGVPVVTLPQGNMMSRWSMSLLASIGMEDLAARSPEDYIAVAAGLTKDRERLTALRHSLRPRLAKSLACNGPKQARHFDRALRAVWKRWCLFHIRSERDERPRR